MKKITLIFTLLLAMTWMACDDDTTPVPHDLDGDWHLESIVCFCPPVNLSLGESIWTFDVANNQLTVQNTVWVQGSMLASGTYTINVDDANMTISEISGTVCDYGFQDNNQTLNIGCEVAVDGPWYKLVRGDS